MSVLYPLTLREDFAHSKTRIKNFKLKALVVILIVCLSGQGVFAQDEKEIQRRREVELKKQEAAEMEAKIAANPTMRTRVNATNNLRSPVQLTDEQEKQIALQKAAAESAKLAAEKMTPSLPGVEYRVITSGSVIEYVVTNAGRVIFKQQINSQGSVYDKQVQAEKEAIYASNTLRRNINYPQDALRAEIKSLVNQVSIPVSETRSNYNQRITADYTFNGGGGSIPGTGTTGIASPYPSTINVSGVPALATVKEVKINGLSHTWSDDVDIVLQSPSGTNVIIMSDAGGAGTLTNVDYIFSDAAALSLADGSGNASGTYKPTNFDADNWPTPGPGTAASAVTLSTFGNGDQNGTWSLFIFDDASGDAGSWTSWSIVFTDPPVVCFPITITGQPANATVCAGTNGSFTVAATPPGVNYNWQVNTGSGFVYLTNGGVYSGVNAATLNITGTTLAMNGYQYRAVVTCSGGGLPEISNPATLTVLVAPGSPAVSPASAAICPGGSQLMIVGGGAQTTFSNLSAITIPASGTSANPAAPYPSSIAIAGLPAQTLVKSVTINGFTHTYPQDVDIILRSPSGATVILMSDVNGTTPTTNANYTLDDAAASLLSTGSNASGTYRPTNSGTGDNWPAPGPGTVNQATPSLGSFGAGNNNGTWELFVYDDAGGDIGSIASWSITFEAVGVGVFSPATGLFIDAGLTTPYVAGTAVSTVYASPSATTTYGVTVNNGNCNSLPTNVTITINQAPAITAQPANPAACVGVTKTLSVTATGASLTYQWQVDMGSGFANITSGTPTNPGGFIYTGQTSATLSINSVMATLNGFKYRVLISGACTPATTSAELTLAVSARPAMSVTSSSQCGPTTLTASGANTYSWAPAAGLSATTGATVTANPTANTIYTVTGTNTTTGCTNTTQVDVKFTPPVPVIAPAAPIICSTAVQQLSITSSSLPSAVNTTSSGAINVAIPDNEPNNGATHSLVVAGVTGAVQSISVTFTITHTWDSDLDINLVAPNGNILNLVGARGGSGDNFTNTIISSTSSTSLGIGSAPFSGTFAADGLIGWGPAAFASNVPTFASLFSVPNGTWRLAMADFGAGDLGTLTSWSISINYATPDAGIWTPATGLFTNAAGTTPYVAGTPAVTVYASPTSTTTYSVSVTNTSTGTRTFSTGGTATIPGTAPININAGAAAPYPSTLAVAGLPANAVVKSVILRGLRHSWSSDIDVLLQSPTGTNVVLMSDVGSSGVLNNVTYTFDDAGNAMSITGVNGTGTYRPTNNGSSDTYPAPIGTVSQASPALSQFTGDLNGTWNLYIADGVAGDIGLLTSWEITFTNPTVTNCTSAPGTVTVTVHTPIVFTTQPQNRTSCQNGTVTFTAAATGTIQTTQWQVSTNAGTTWTDIAGATTTTLTLTNVQPSQNGYRYRLVLSNAGCGTINSNAAILTVNPLPTVSLALNPAGQTQLRPGMLTTVTVNSTPAGASYQWFINGVAQPSITGSSYVVDAYHLGTYTVRVTDVNGCVNTTSGITFTALPTSNLFVYPNPTTGAFYITYYIPQAGVPVTISVLDMMGRKIVERHEATAGPYTRFDFSSSKLTVGVYLIQFHRRGPGGGLLETKQLVVMDH